MKRVCSVLLAVALLAGMLTGVPFSVSAATEGDFTYELLYGSGETTVTNYIGNDVDVTIPSTLGGYPVTKIGEGAFIFNTDLTSVTIPDSVWSIGYEAFESTGLTSVIIPESVRQVGDWSFAYCTGLTGITLESGVMSIGSYAFCGCTGLTSVIIPDSVWSIGSCAFTGCKGLTDIYCLAPKKPGSWNKEWLGDCEATVHWGEAMPKPEEPSTSDDSKDEPKDEPKVLATGDLGGDGEVDATDYMLLKRAVLETYTLTEEQRVAADINGDGEVNATDYMLLKRAVLGTYVIG